MNRSYDEIMQPYRSDDPVIQQIANAAESIFKQELIDNAQRSSMFKAGDVVKIFATGMSRWDNFEAKVLNADENVNGEIHLTPLSDRPDTGEKSNFYWPAQYLTLVQPVVKPVKYRHYKGGVYTGICLASHTENDETLVIYRSENGGIWARPAPMFFGEVEIEPGIFIPRFEQIEET
jgi:hypothetical protein